MRKKKDNLMQKMVKKSYEDELEEILVEKDFEENVKNLLLSIFYKIEIAYKDYEIVKRNVTSKKQYMENLLNTIKYNCDSIKFVRPNSEESRIIGEKTFEVNKEKKQIICYPIEKKLLYSISKIRKNEKIIKDDYYLINETLSDVINIGNNINTVEPLRDFNGFSWNIVKQEIENSYCNLIYQNMILLIGVDILDEWTNQNEFMIDYIELVEIELEKEYGKENSKYIIELISKISILIKMQIDKNYKHKLLVAKEKIENDLMLMQDKKKYISNTILKKKELTEKIKQIEKTINNKKLLEEEYIQRNENLPLEKKIFSIRILKQKLEEEKKDIIRQIEELDDLLKPKRYIEEKNKLENKLEYLNLAMFEDIVSEIEVNTLKLQEFFIRCLEIKIDKATSKQEVINLMYQIRYYLAIPLNKEKNIGQIETILNNIEEIQKKLFKKSIQFNQFVNISECKKINFNIFKTIFNLNVIEIEKIYIKIIKEKGEIYLQYYDEDICEEKIRIEKNILDEKDLKIKFGRKIKLLE